VEDLPAAPGPDFSNTNLQTMSISDYVASFVGEIGEIGNSILDATVGNAVDGLMAFGTADNIGDAAKGLGQMGLGYANALPVILAPITGGASTTVLALETGVESSAEAAIAPVISEEIGEAAASQARGDEYFLGAGRQGIFEADVNPAGGKVWTADGKIDIEDISKIVNEAGTGDINILSGAHGSAAGALEAAPQFFADDVAEFGNMPNVKVFDIMKMQPAEVEQLVNGPGTTIGGICNSGACLAKYMPWK
jgi:hypothetical protein